MMSRLAVVLLVMVLHSFDGVKGKCVNPNPTTQSSLTVFPSNGLQIFTTISQNLTNNAYGTTGGGQFSFYNQFQSICSCTKGQAVYSILDSGGAFTNVDSKIASVAVACNTTTQFCMKGSNGKKYKLKFAENLLDPPVLIMASGKPGKPVNYAVLNCPVASTVLFPAICVHLIGKTIGCSIDNSTATFNKKAGFGKKWTCGKQHGPSGTKQAPDFKSQKGKYIKIKSVSCGGCSNLKKCK